MVAGPGLHGARAVRVAGSKGFRNGSGGLSAGITCPTQCELQCGSLRKCLKWWQSLWDSHTCNGQWHGIVKATTRSRWSKIRNLVLNSHVQKSVMWQMRSCTLYTQTHTHTNKPVIPSHPEWFPMWLASCSQGCPPSLASKPRTPHPAVAIFYRGQIRAND